jgi:hypothetical protein
MISDAELLAYVRPSTDDDLTELRRLERAAVSRIQSVTGAYYGPADEVIEIVHRYGPALLLANEPVGDLTSLESWDGTAWSDVDTTGYYIDGKIIRFAGTWVPSLGPTRYRATYDAGFEETDVETTAAPEDLRQAALLYVTYFFDKRDSEDYDGFARAFNDLVDPFKRVSV